LKRFTALLICIVTIFSVGCGRNLPTESETPAAAPQSAVVEVKPEPKPEEKAEPAPEPKEEPSSEPAAVSSEPSSSGAASDEPPISLSAKASVTTERDWRLMLVNPDNILPENFSVDLTMTKYGYEVDSRIVDDVTALIDGAANDGVKLLICYGYRTLEQSQQLFDKQLRKQLSYGLSEEAALAEAKRWVAPPGTSDHHTGLALDIVTPEHQVLNHAFYNTPAGQWMAEHSWEYGFVIRFPEDKQDITGITYEPWHLRFVGKEHAAKMHKNNECLEEYFARLYGE